SATQATLTWTDNAANETGLTSSTYDVITDFKHLEDDINLQTIDASSILAGNNAFVWRSTGAFTTSTSGELRYKIFNNAGTANDYTMIYGDTDGDTAAEFQIKLTGLVTLTSSDFVF
ncbi:MAG TPA: RTX toxin, partial [Hyphomicrobium sp.]|nr:RTX toxin [Hyphomicrobium sp.]